MAYSMNGNLVVFVHRQTAVVGPEHFLDATQGQISGCGILISPIVVPKTKEIDGCSGKCWTQSIVMLWFICVQIK